MKRPRSRVGLLRIAPALVAAAAVFGQGAPALPCYGVRAPFPWESGPCANAGAAMASVAIRSVTVPGATSLRLFFSTIELGPAGRIRFTGIQDGEVQELDAAGVFAWDRSSAAFNGDTVIISLLAPPGAAVSCALDEVLAGVDPVGTDTLCGVDDRVASGDPRCARLLGSNGFICSGFLVSAGGTVLSAGHCWAAGLSLAQFDVPPSLASGAIQHPPVADQHPIDPTTVAFASGGLGDDWGGARALPSSLGVSPGSLRGWFALAAAVPSPGTMLRATGFGVDAGASSATNQTSEGPLLLAPGSILVHAVDTDAGSSGSPLIESASGLVVGIHAAGGCTIAPGSANGGTSILRPALQAAVASLGPPAPPLVLAVTTSGVQDVGLSLTGLPPGVTEGFTLLSGDTTAPAGHGDLLGLRADALTSLVLSSPPSSPLHFVAPFAPGAYPLGPLQGGPGAVTAFAGLTIDVQVAVLGGPALLAVSNVVRVGF